MNKYDLSHFQVDDVGLICRTVLTVVTAVAIWAPFDEARAENKCAAVYSSQAQLFIERPKTIDLTNTRALIKEESRSVSVGRVANFYSPKFETRIYHNLLTSVDNKGRVPVISPDARAVYIFFHGNGTMKSSGSNFGAMMNDLATMNLAALSFDLPFHADGPRSEKFKNADHVLEWAREIIQTYKISGKPVYLVGHSFGPDLAAEVMTRFPKLTNGALLLSPAAFDSVLQKWYEDQTVNMNFGEPVPENNDGALWGSLISEKFNWRDPKKNMDPSKRNPNLKIRVVTGTHEEYAPAPIGGPNNTPVGMNTYDIGQAMKKLISGAELVYIKDVGHYIFDAVDSKKRNIILREVVRMYDESFENFNELRTTTDVTSSTDLAFRISTDALFSSWAISKYGEKHLNVIINKQLDAIARKIVMEYGLYIDARRMEIMKEIIDYADANPEFLAKYKSLIDQLRAAKKPNTSANPIYLKELESKSQ
jgi:hypothetical protein